jgi:glycosyltransferase involved in cell wall biosynthesis
MKVLFLLDHLGYAGGAWHGRTAYLNYVLPELRRLGCEVELCVLRGEHPAADRLRQSGIEVECFDAPRRSLRSLIRLARRIRSEGADVLHATQRESSALARALAPFVPRTAIVTHIVDATPVPALERHLNRMLPQPDVTLCVSRAVRPTAVAEYGVLPPRVRVLHNGVKLATLAPSGRGVRERLRAEWGIPLDAPVIVSASRLHPEKRLDVLLGMMPEVLAQCPGAFLVLAGDGDELAAYRELKRSLGVAGSVRFLGHRNDVADVLAASDVAVMLCLEEAFGFAAVEAHAIGLPVVAYRAGGLPEIVMHERNGLLVPAGNDAAFRDELVRVLQDGGLRARLGAAARDDVKRFDVAVHARVLLRLYEELSSHHQFPALGLRWRK